MAQSNPQTILITGASTGIGYDAAKQLGQMGMHVIAGARKDSDIERLNALDNVTGIRLDVTKQEDRDEAIKHIEALGNGLDVLINNAGIAVGAPIMDVSGDDLRWQFEVNVFCLVELTQACFPFLLKNKGRVINISSMAGRMVMPFMAPYAMSKFAVEAFTDGLRRELRPFGLKVVAIQPGPIKTAIWDKTDPETLQYAGSPFEDRARRAGKMLIKAGQEQSLPVETVTRVIKHAITSRSPKTRYIVTKGKWFRLFLNSLPDKWSDAVLTRIFPE